ncbi:hypothetical protein Taro_053728 [Colocasia esculenta]|uniref:Uncharacterized protein n=1 Tax=Colocasia esculenta TaxID=4460 RepID=A0A843XLX4_COLES|nr:hypothetical protein [Colocasia esculenta]
MKNPTGIIAFILDWGAVSIITSQAATGPPRRAWSNAHWSLLASTSLLVPMAAATLSFLAVATIAGGHRQPSPRARISAFPASRRTRSNRFSFFRDTRYAADLHLKRRIATIASSNGDSSKNDSNITSSTGGPPLLTILAGVLVFLLVSWVVGSIVLWLIGLIVNAPPSK